LYWLCKEDVTVDVQEGLRLQRVRLYLGVCPMLRQTERLVIDNVDFCVGKMQQVYEEMLPLFVSVKRNLIVVLPQAQAA
jgi:hypothetical protein